MTSSAPAWVGYGHDGGRETLRHEEYGAKSVVLGQRASEFAALLCFASHEAGNRITILDLDGFITKELPGIFQTYGYGSFLYDAYRIEGLDAAHGQLIAAAYTTALDLTSEEEAIIGSALQILASQDNMASPPVIFDALGKVEGFRGFYVDKLRGRIGMLKLLDATDDESCSRLLRGNALVSFAGSPYPQAKELAAALMLAKLLALQGSDESKPDVLVLTGSHQVFRRTPRQQHSERLLAQLLESDLPLVLASDLPSALSPTLGSAIPMKVYSSDAWNVSKGRERPGVLASSFVIENAHLGSWRAFVPRTYEPRPAPGGPPAGHAGASPDLTRQILDTISRYETATRQSVTAYLSIDYLRRDIELELDRLHGEGFILLEAKEEGSGPAVFAYTITEDGRKLLGGLRK